MKVTSFAALILLAGSFATAQQPAAPVEALDGIDTVVLLKEGKEVFGKQAFRSESGRFTYLFSSAQTKAEFDKAPQKYVIQMGGLCARMGRTVTGNPSDYIVHEGKIYIFGSDACHKSFAAAPDKYLPKKAAPMPRDTAATQRGHALLEKAAAGIGEAKVDAITTYVETTSETQQRPTGEVKIVARKLWRFPGGARAERIVPMQNGEIVTFGTLLTREGAWGIGGQRTTPVIPEAIPSVQHDLGRQIIPVLRSRREAGTTVASLGAATVDGVAVERVRVQRGGLDVTLNVHASTGRIHSTTFVDRNRDGQFGEYTLLYADFRQVDGLLLPFEEKALFNGAPDASLSRKLDSISVNATLDAALFQAPR